MTESVERRIVPAVVAELGRVGINIEVRWTRMASEDVALLSVANRYTAELRAAIETGRATAMRRSEQGGQQLRRSGLIAVVDVRLTQLGEAVGRRSWADVDWEMERTRSALDKALSGGAPRGVAGRPS